MDHPELLTVDQAAAYLQITEKAARHMIARGQMPGLVRLGRRIRVRRDALQRLGVK